jgi:hypothetical protein
LQGTPTNKDYIELAWLDQHYNYQLGTKDTLSSAAAALAGIITANQQTGLVSATADGATITLTYLGVSGSNGNRIGVYGTVYGAGTRSPGNRLRVFQDGVSPAAWQVRLNFANLTDLNGVSIPAVNLTNVRKLRWTWAADMQAADFQRSEFSVVVSNWTVTGTGQQYQVAGPGSRRIEDDSETLTYTGSWVSEIGKLLGRVHTIDDAAWLCRRMLLCFSVCSHLVPGHSGACGRRTGNGANGRRHADHSRPGACR